MWVDRRAPGRRRRGGRLGDFDAAAGGDGAATVGELVIVAVEPGAPDPDRRRAGTAGPGRAQRAQLLVEQHALVVEQLAPAIEIQKLLMKLCLLLFQRGDFLLYFGAQLVQVVGGRIGCSGNRQCGQA